MEFISQNIEIILGFIVLVLTVVFFFLPKIKKCKHKALFSILSFIVTLILFLLYFYFSIPKEKDIKIVEFCSGADEMQNEIYKSLEDDAYIKSNKVTFGDINGVSIPYNDSIDKYEHNTGKYKILLSGEDKEDKKVYIAVHLGFDIIESGLCVKNTDEIESIHLENVMEMQKKLSIEVAKKLEDSDPYVKAAQLIKDFTVAIFRFHSNCDCEQQKYDEIIKKADGNQDLIAYCESYKAFCFLKDQDLLAAQRAFVKSDSLKKSIKSNKNAQVIARYRGDTVAIKRLKEKLKKDFPNESDKIQEKIIKQIPDSIIKKDTNIIISSIEETEDVKIDKPLIIDEKDSIIPIEDRESRHTIVKGSVISEESKKPLDAIIEVVDNEAGEVISSLKSNIETGMFLLSLPSGKDYGIAVKKDGYLFHSENFNIPSTQNYQEIKLDIKLREKKE